MIGEFCPKVFALKTVTALGLKIRAGKFVSKASARVATRRRLSLPSVVQAGRFEVRAADKFLL
jgi:hypothetical protein